MKCQYIKDVCSCDKAAVWIIEYLEGDGVQAVCAGHLALCFVNEQRVIKVTSMSCGGPHAMLLRKRLEEEPYPELLKKG